jgi:hypothetical protein
MTLPALEGRVQSDEVTRLKREIVGLEQELRDARAEAQTAKQAAADSVAAVDAMRKQLEPEYTALRMLFGQIDRVDVPGNGGAAAARGGTGARIESLKARFPGKAAEIIQLLAEHGQMSRSQLAAALHVAPQTVSDTVFRIKSFLTKNGGMYSLREQ